jgi:hypothetical protein
MTMARPNTSGRRFLILEPGAPHPLDERIDELLAELRELVHRRTCDRKRASLIGRRLSPATRAKISRSKLGKKMSAEARENIRKAQKARYLREHGELAA